MAEVPSKPAIATRRLGQGLVVSTLGLGCMGMSQNYGPTDDVESLATIERALDLGMSFLDTADLYGDGANEELIGHAIAGRREEVVLATKFGRTRGGGHLGAIRGDPEYVIQACDASLSRLGVDYIDLFYQHRVDKSVPIEETWGALSELVSAGKVRHLGISEASAATVRRAHAIHPISASQNEYSLFTRDLEDDLLATFRELEIGLVCSSPLGHGLLTATIGSVEKFSSDDNRRGKPRFEGENFEFNAQVVENLRDFAASRGLTAPQLTLAWLLAQGNDVVPIPGTKRRRYLDENARAANVELNAEDLRIIEAIAPKGSVAGEPNTPEQMSTVNL